MTMKSPSNKNQLDIIRRIAERGRSLAYKDKLTWYVDLFQHILDELERIKDE